MPTTFVTEAEAIISVTLGSSQSVFPANTKSWSTYEGGDLQAATSQLLPGGMQPAVALPGPSKRSNVTISLPYTLAIHAQVSNLEKYVNGPMSVSYTPTDAAGNANGTPVTRSGILKQPGTPKFDSKSGDAAMLTLVMECNT